MWVVDNDETGLPCSWWLQENTLVECKIVCVCVCVCVRACAGKQWKLDQSLIKLCGYFAKGVPQI